MARVTALDFSGNSVGDDEAEALAYELHWVHSLDQLLVLGLGDNGIGTRGIAALASSIQALTKLQVMNLRNNSIRSEGSAHLGQALACLESLTALDIAHNALGASGTRTIITKGLKALVKLRSLDVNTNAIGAAGMRCLKALVNLQQLNVSDEAARNNEVAELGRTLRALTALTALSVWVAGPAVMRSLTQGLKAVTKLKRLDLHRQRMGADGAQALADALRAMTQLTYLNVQALHVSFGMGESGLKHVAPKLQELRLMAHLNLADNAMGVEGVRALARAMTSLTALTYLELGNNAIETSGAAVLGPALTHLSRLAELRLDPDDTLDHAAFQPVARALAALPALVHVAVPDGCEDSTW